MNQLRISSTLNLHSYPTDDISEYIRQGLISLKNCGFDAADFPTKLFKLIGDQWEDYILTAIEDSKKLGILFEVCHLPFAVNIDFFSEKGQEFSKLVHRSIDAAKLLNVRYAVLHPNTTTLPLEGFDSQKRYDEVMAHLSPFAEHAAKIGLNVVVENMRMVHGPVPSKRYCGTPEELCKVADALGVGVCWDFGHAHINGLKQSEALAYVGSRLKVLHVNDNTSTDDDHMPPFVGTIDWKDAMAGLRSVNFQGLFNYEINTSRVPGPVRDSFARYLAAAAHQLLQM